MEPGDCLVQQFSQFPVRIWLAGDEIIVAVHAVFLHNRSQHHFRMVNKITVVRDPVLVFFHGKPGCVLFIRYNLLDPLFQKQDVCGCLCPRNLLKGIVRQADGPDQLRTLGQILPDRLVFFIHGEFRGNDGHDAPCPELIQALCQEIIMYPKFIAVIPPVADPDAVERHIPHYHIKETVGEICVLISFDQDVRLGVKFPGNASRNRFQLHSIEF